ncbi:hypothetical protein GCM10023082_30510 [Streptomyces tremellae]|uniref:Uncharacterized protein n=1 Tax=Streptomyces tremellae TaxID=1124239 RepID=A0ABP7F3M9_9ACTN
MTVSERHDRCGVGSPERQYFGLEGLAPAEVRCRLVGLVAAGRGVGPGLTGSGRLKPAACARGGAAHRRAAPPRALRR